MEIKLKAWVKHEEVMATVEVLDIAHRKAYLRFSEEMQSLDGYFYLGDIELLPCTNLKDKNGKEIYVGDILKWDEKEWGCPFNEVAKWDYELLSMRENDWCQWCEIVGNIYENLELIKENDDVR